ncbi:Actin-binding Rho-activating protein [Trichostrongylus colubriformis]|uniref:Actin-binding Rho-activating protein n=1 Tax=Trichostrongylus colubriformis TaxID=6319 RepID=A0AAN8F6B5_TRICO
MLKFRELEKEEQAARKNDVYSTNYVPKKFSKHSAEYGTPRPGTLTEMRAKKASKHIAKEMMYLCEVIRDYGYRSNDGRVKITFGKLFSVYQYISDKVVGMLLRARKHHMVEFEGEMLFQRRDEAVIITLLLSDEELERGIEESKK